MCYCIYKHTQSPDQTPRCEPTCKMSTEEGNTCHLALTSTLRIILEKENFLCVHNIYIYIYIYNAIPLVKSIMQN